MKALIVIVFLFTFSLSFTQDTVRYGSDLVIFNQGKIIQKEFKSSKNYIKIVYQYDQNGILIRRFWYDINGRLLSVTLDN